MKSSFYLIWVNVQFNCQTQHDTKVYAVAFHDPYLHVLKYNGFISHFVKKNTSTHFCQEENLRTKSAFNFHALNSVVVFLSFP